MKRRLQTGESESGSLDVEWGKVMRYQLGGEDIPANGGFGNLGNLPRHYIRPPCTMGRDRRFTVKLGSPWWSLAINRSCKVLMSYGNSSNPVRHTSPDQLPYLARRNLRTAWRTRKDIEAHLESKVTF